MVSVSKELSGKKEIEISKGNYNCVLVEMNRILFYGQCGLFLPGFANVEWTKTGQKGSPSVNKGRIQSNVICSASPMKKDIYYKIQEKYICKNFV